MHRTIAVILLTMATLGSSACRETDIAPTDPINRPFPAPADGLLIAIEGPSVLENSGIYEWRADVRGAFEDIEYEWVVEGLDTNDVEFDRSGPVLELEIDVFRLRELRIELRVRTSDERENVSELVVAVCPFSESIDQCPRRVFQQNREFPR